MKNEKQLKQLLIDCSQMRITGDKAIEQIMILINGPCVDCGEEQCICTKLLIIDYGDDEE